MESVSRRDRQIDIAALLLIVLGTALYLGARARMLDIAQRYSWRQPGPAGAVTLVDQAMNLTYAGVALIVVGCSVAAVGALLHSRRRRGTTPA